MVAAVVTVGIGAFVMSVTLFSGFPQMAAAAGLGATLLWIPVAWISLRLCGTESKATRLCLMGSLIAGVLDVLVASLAVGLYPGSNRFLDEAVPDAIMGATAIIVGSIVYGAPPGLVFGVLFVLPVRRVHALVRNKAHEVGDRALRVCGGWLFIIGFGCSLLIIMMTPSVGQLSPVRASTAAGVGAVACLGALVAIAAHVRIVRRQRWFERIQAGKEAGWTIVPRSFFPEGLDDLQPLFASGSHHNVVLVQHESVGGGGAYRNASNLVPRALVHLPEGLAALSFALPNEEEERTLQASELGAPQ
jgi:hypothetical protein